MKTTPYGDKKLPFKSRKIAKAIRKRLIKEDSKCEECGETERLTIDHIIPCCILRDMGFGFYEDDENIRLMCETCNDKKSERLDFTEPRNIPLLRRYLDLIELSQKMKTLKWFKDRIGKRIFRDFSECPCKDCKETQEFGIMVVDAQHAEYLYDIQNEYKIDGIDLNYRDTK